jgi:NAD(P)-dependent dehydrogenase (short-subunit alcohol dehydrogenase family)
VVVGGARGIGRAVAEEFAAEGCGVAIMDRDPESPAVATVIAAGKGDGVRGWGRAVDATDYEAVRAAVAECRAAMGRIDHVVFAVGVGSGKFGFPFWNLEAADWPRVINVNLLAAVNVAHAVAPVLVEAKGGTVTFLSSVAGQIGSQTDPPYSAAKAALINFAQCAAKDLAPPRRAGQHHLPGDDQDRPEPLGLGGLGASATAGAAPQL